MRTQGIIYLHFYNSVVVNYYFPNEKKRKKKFQKKI